MRSTLKFAEPFPHSHTLESPTCKQRTLKRKSESKKKPRKPRDSSEERDMDEDALVIAGSDSDTDIDEDSLDEIESPGSSSPVDMEKKIEFLSSQLKRINKLYLEMEERLGREVNDLHHQLQLVCGVVATMYPPDKAGEIPPASKEPAKTLETVTTSPISNKSQSSSVSPKAVDSNQTESIETTPSTISPISSPNVSPGNTKNTFVVGESGMPAIRSPASVKKEYIEEVDSSPVRTNIPVQHTEKVRIPPMDNMHFLELRNRYLRLNPEIPQYPMVRPENIHHPIHVPYMQNRAPLWDSFHRPLIFENAHVPTEHIYPITQKRRREEYEQYSKSDKPKKRRGNLPEKATSYLKAWLFSHEDRPYPTEDEKGELVLRTGLTLVQINNWFSNARRRILKRGKDGEFETDSVEHEIV